MKKLLLTFTILFPFLFHSGYCSKYSDLSEFYTYYLDSSGGNDTLSGLSTNEAWKSLERANQITYQPGDSILLKRGSSWTGIFEPKGSGRDGLPIVISAYGSGEKPVIDAGGAVSDGQEYSATLRLFNQEYWLIRDIQVKNFGSSRLYRFAILVEGRDIGTLHGFTFINVKVSDVNGIIKNEGSLKARENGGLKMLISRSSDNAKRVPSNFDGILVDSCVFMNTSRSGFFTVSAWKTRDLYSNFGEQTMDGKTNEWYPSHNLVVRNSSFLSIGGNGLVTRVAESPLVEHNYFFKCGIHSTGNASYPYSCNNALWQFNEACYTDYSSGDADASGFDSDYFCKNTIIQYNYSHDNEWGSILICSNGTMPRAFNDGTIVRYNVFQNDGHHSIRVSGSTTNTYVYNNVIYLGKSLSNVDIIWHKKWGTYADKTNYFNNIIFNEASNSSYDFGSSTHNVFSNNLFYGNQASNEPASPNKITSDPLFVDPGKGGYGFESLGGYMLQWNSPAIDAGKNMVDGELKDFFGNPVPARNAVDIGVYESQIPLAIRDMDEQSMQISLGPNPATSLTIIDIRGDYIGEISFSCLDISGKVIKNETFSKNGILLSRVINLESYPVGIYFLRIQYPGSAQTLKLIKVMN